MENEDCYHVFGLSNWKNGVYQDRKTVRDWKSGRRNESEVVLNKLSYFELLLDIEVKMLNRQLVM